MAGLHTPHAGLCYSGGNIHSIRFFHDAAFLCDIIDHDAIDRLAARLSTLKGRLYIIGLGGSLANAIHMAADLRKLCNIDAEAFDNIAELTARMNDEGPETIFDSFLTKSGPQDALMVLSVGGGTMEVSRAICRAVERAKRLSVTIFGITGPNGGYTAEHADLCIKIPTEHFVIKGQGLTTPLTEAFQALVWHCLVSHPLLQKNKPKW